MAGPARVILLVGPKGAGKTTLGRFLERATGAFFLEVELIARRTLAAMGGVINEAYARQVFAEIVAEVDVLAADHALIALETTGASDETPGFLAALRRRHDVRLVRVRAAAETCASRIATRDSARQIDVPVDLIRAMHERTEALRLPWDLDIDNDPPLPEDEVARAFAPLIERSS